MTVTAEDINTKVSYLTKIWWTELSFGGGEHNEDLTSQTYPADQTFIEQILQQNCVNIDTLKPESIDNVRWESLVKIALIKETARDIIVDDVMFKAPMLEESIKNIYINAEIKDHNDTKSVVIAIYGADDIVDQFDEQKTILFTKAHKQPFKQIYPVCSL